MEITAIPEKKIFGGTGSWSVMLYYSETEIPNPYSKDGHLFTVTGENLPDSGTIVLYGEWKTSKYGWQFNAESFLEKDPEDRHGIEKLILAMRIKGLGKARTARLIRSLGINTLKILDDDPWKLAESGLAGAKLREAVKCYEEQRVLRGTFLALQKYHISLKICAEFIQKMGTQAADYFLRHPYELCAEKGISFKQIDEVEKKQPNFDPTSSERLAAAMIEVLKQAHLEGHMLLPSNTLVQRASEVASDADINLVKSVGKLMLKNNLLRNVGNGIFLPTDFEVEYRAAMDTVRLLKAEYEIPQKHLIDKLLKEFEDFREIKLDQIQKNAVHLVLSNPFSIMTGGAGVGKTTVIRAILFVYHRIYPALKTLLMAPTGKASRRMTECTGEDAYTIHKILYAMEQGFDKCSMIEEDFIIIDEASMIDGYLFKQLLSRIRTGANVLFVGDPYQLPSVQPGSVLEELLSVSEIPSIELTCNFRQRDARAILTNSQRIRNGEKEIIEDDTFCFISETEMENIASEIRTRFLDMQKDEGLDMVQILSPYKRKTPIGADLLNKTIQEELHPESERHIRYAGRNFFVGDKVIQTENIDEQGVVNGEIGYVLEVMETEDGVALIVRFYDRDIEYSEADLPNLDLAYAVSVHKYQGSECPQILLPVHPVFGKMLQRNLLYTAVTRASEGITIIGNRNSFTKGIEVQQIGKRYTMLSYLIKKNFSMP